MSADDELYCLMMDWREMLEKKHSLAISFSEKGQDLERETFFSQIADEITDVLAKCDATCKPPIHILSTCIQTKENVDR